MQLTIVVQIAFATEGGCISRSVWIISSLRGGWRCRWTMRAARRDSWAAGRHAEFPFGGPTVTQRSVSAICAPNWNNYRVILSFFWVPIVSSSVNGINRAACDLIEAFNKFINKYRHTLHWLYSLHCKSLSHRCSIKIILVNTHKLQLLSRALYKNGTLRNL